VNALIAAATCGGRSMCVVTTSKGQSYIWNGSTWSGPTTFAFDS
jgi:hypothetical protein